MSCDRHRQTVYSKCSVYPAPDLWYLVWLHLPSQHFPHMVDRRLFSRELPCANAVVTTRLKWDLPLKTMRQHSEGAYDSPAHYSRQNRRCTMVNSRRLKGRRQWSLTTRFAIEPAIQDAAWRVLQHLSGRWAAKLTGQLGLVSLSAHHSYRHTTWDDQNSSGMLACLHISTDGRTVPRQRPYGARWRAVGRHDQPASRGPRLGSFSKSYIRLKRKRIINGKWC